MSYRDKKTPTKVVMHELPAGEQERARLEAEFAEKQAQFESLDQHIKEREAGLQAFMDQAQEYATRIRKAADEHAHATRSEAKRNFKESLSFKLDAEKTLSMKEAALAESEETLQKQNRVHEIAKADLATRSKELDALGVKLQGLRAALSKTSVELVDGQDSLKKAQAELEEANVKLDEDLISAKALGKRLDHREQDLFERDRAARERENAIAVARSRISQDEEEFKKTQAVWNKFVATQEDLLLKQAEALKPQHDRQKDLDYKEKLINDRERAVKAGESKLAGKHRQLGVEREELLGRMEAFEARRLEPNGN